MDQETLHKVRYQLPLPPLLIELIKRGRWVHPGEDVMRSRVPFITDPLVFLDSRAEMLFESSPLMGRSETESETFSQYRGSAVAARGLPWIDIEKTLFVICNKNPGDDVGIALDYRTGLNSPRVIGGDWRSGSCIYHEICLTFDAFVELLGL